MSEQTLRDAGLKITFPRLRILQILHDQDSGRHMSAEDVYKVLIGEGADIGLATVYRVLTQFEAAGLVSRLNFEKGYSIFELRESDHHDHMVCIDTGEIIEFSDDVIEKRQEEIAKAHGYTLEDHSLVLFVRKKKQ